ncbi:MAG: hypothetical protein RLY16_2761 [Bacteroidota bacterium]
METSQQFLAINKASWNHRTVAHLNTPFYNLPGFMQGENMLKSIELNLLGDISGLKVLHLQCHFGLDTLSLARMGAQVTGVDLSDVAIQQAQTIAAESGINASFICCDVYDLPNHLNEKFDLVFTSYGTITWLPDLDKWAHIIQHFLKTEGRFVFAEFHPVVWMFDDNFSKLQYDYFNTAPIVETEAGTYADQAADLSLQYVTWNHPISEVLQALIKNGLALQQFQEFDYSPYPCFKNLIEKSPGKFVVEHVKTAMPMVYAIEAQKHS